MTLHLIVRADGTNKNMWWCGQLFIRALND